MDRLGNEQDGPPGPDDLEAAFQTLLGRARVSLDDWEIDEQTTSNAQAALEARAMPVTLARIDVLPPRRQSALWLVGRSTLPPKRRSILTAELLERASVVRVVGDPRRTRQDPNQAGHLVPPPVATVGYTTTETARR